MEEFQLYREKAAKNIKVAEHTLAFTYPVVQDTRLLLGVAENLYLALQNAMYSIVAYERLFRRLPQHPDDFEIKYRLFAQKIAPRYNIKNEHVQLIQRMHSIITNHRQSPVEFSRKDKFVICSEGFKVQTLSIKDLQNFIITTNEFFNEVNSITAKHEKLFSRR